MPFQATYILFGSRGVIWGSGLLTHSSLSGGTEEGITSLLFIIGGIALLNSCIDAPRKSGCVPAGAPGGRSIGTKSCIEFGVVPGTHVCHSGVLPRTA